MSYQVLARKWRPRVFSQVVGQESVLRALINALDEQRLHHAYLFTGTRGVGKTTLARILAMCFNCEKGVSSTPCGQCAACNEIKEGRFVDLIEVDAASRTKVEDTRELLDNVQYAPTRGRYKVYLIDEVHMLSSHSFNALLKTLEEPPEHVKFLLATTDPQKLPITVLSRCLQFSLKNMSADKIVGHLQYVLGEEKVAFEEPALWSLAHAAQGSMRDALSLTDQAIAFGQGSIKEQQVSDMLGTLNRADVYLLAEQIANNQVQALFDEVTRLSEQAVDYDEVCQALMNLWHKVALAQINPEHINDNLGDKEAVLALAKALQPEDVQLFYQITLTGRQELPLASEPRQAFEMMLVRLMAFRPATNIPENLSLESCLKAHKPEPKKQLDSVVEDEKKNTLADFNTDFSSTENTPVQAYNSQPEHTPAPHTQTRAEPEPAELEQVKTEQAQPIASSFEVKADEPCSDKPNPFAAIQEASNCAVSEPVVAEQTVEKDNEPQTVTAELAQPPKVESWHEDVEKLNLAGISVGIIRDTALVSVTSLESEQEPEQYGVMELDVSPNQTGLFSESIKKRLISALQARWPDYQVNMQLREPRLETPAQRSKRVSSEQMHSATEMLKQDENIGLVLDYFDGHIIESSIKPITS